jgi:CRISPR-associated helicase Cas3/CRISPR-associated endonuclease Cas3-HD
LAHIRPEDGAQQSVLEHLRGTGALAEEFAGAFGAEEWARFCGLAHDIGKYSNAFQRHIGGEAMRVDHATAGAQMCVQLLGKAGWLPAYCVAGHHGGLPNGGNQSDPPAREAGRQSTLTTRLRLPVEDYSAYAAEVSLEGALHSPPLRPLGRQGFSLAFWVRMLFSCLVDADFLDTERFMRPGAARSGAQRIEALEALLDAQVRRFASPASALNRMRTEILHGCIAKAALPPGLFTLTVPTGGGKTISSLAFALKHARANGLRRVIYVIPYHSIIEQNARVFREILGDENVLEHHTSFDYDDWGSGLGEQYRLAAENWDMPLVVTTNVQFFESLFGNKTARCRKLHSIAGSVVIFDEAQMLPLPYLRPCVRAIAELCWNYRCSCVLCSATQPTLAPLFPRELPPARELCDNSRALYDAFRKTRLTLAGPLTNEELARQLRELPQALCIVSTRNHAQTLFQMLKDETGVFHLSTLMCPAHRSKVLETIRERLKARQPCRVISTSLVEAGVDLDFPVVYRALAGIDSLVQAAGRCNREKELDCGQVIVFEPEEAYVPKRAAFQRPREITRLLARQFDDLSAPEAIQTYFELLYQTDNLDAKEMVNRFEDGARSLCFPFAEAAQEFRLIEESTRSVLAPLDERARELAEQLRFGLRSRALLRRAQQYIVSVYPYEYEALLRCGALEPLDEALAVLADVLQYDPRQGLKVKFEEGKAIMP